MSRTTDSRSINDPSGTPLESNNFIIVAIKREIEGMILYRFIKLQLDYSCWEPWFSWKIGHDIEHLNVRIGMNSGQVWVLI